MSECKIINDMKAILEEWEPVEGLTNESMANMYP